MTITADQFLQYVQDHFNKDLEEGEKPNYGYNDNELWYEVESYDHTPIGDYNFTTLERDGGEGEGDRLSVVVLVEGEFSSQFFVKEGYWVSYDGAYWNEGGDPYEVEPYEVTVTKYKKI